MSAPEIETIRPGVAFTPAAAASFRRVESHLGRKLSTNSTYRDYDKQMRMFRAWNAYVAGTGPKPPHSRAIHPDYSKHCQGLALDSNEWTIDAVRFLLKEHGWIRTAAADPTERHHFEYQQRNDRHLGQPAGVTVTPAPPFITEEKEEEMTATYVNVKGTPKVRRGGCYAILRDNSGKLFARFVSPTPLATAPTISGDRELKEWDASIPGLK